MASMQAWGSLSLASRRARVSRLFSRASHSASTSRPEAFVEAQGLHVGVLVLLGPGLSHGRQLEGVQRVEGRGRQHAASLVVVVPVKDHVKLPPQSSCESPPHRGGRKGMDAEVNPVGSPSGGTNPTEVRMLREDLVREILARGGARGGVKGIARELGVDRKTVKAWRQRGDWRARPAGTAPARTGRVSCPIHRGVRARGRVERGRGASGVAGPRVHGRVSADPAVPAAAAGRAAVGGHGERAVRDRAGRAGTSGLRAAAHLDRRHGDAWSISSCSRSGYSRRLWTRAYPHERLDVVFDRA